MGTGARIVLLLPLLLACAHCTARTPQLPADEPVPPDPEGITVYGRYQPSLESLAPPGIELGDMNMIDGRLVIQVHADGEPSRKAFVRALEGSGWYRAARWETVESSGVRQGEYVLSVRPRP